MAAVAGAAARLMTLVAQVTAGAVGTAALHRPIAAAQATAAVAGKRARWLSLSALSLQSLQLVAEFARRADPGHISGLVCLWELQAWDLRYV